MARALAHTGLHADLRPHVRRARPDDIAQLINLQFEVYPPSGFPPVNRWGASSLEAHQRVFPEGQLVAEIEGRIVGAAVTLVGRAARFCQPHTFMQAIGNTKLKAHDPRGDALYGVDICVSPFFRRRGVARALYDARFDLQRRLKLRSFFAGARIPGYGALKDAVPVERYLDEVRRGERTDPTLSAQLKVGFQALLPLPGYLPDPETGDYAVLIRRELPEAEVRPFVRTGPRVVDVQ